MILGVFAGSSGAGVADYSGTLYLDGGASGISGSSFELLPSAGPSVPSTPTTVAGGAGSGAITPAGSYQYVQVNSSGGARTASAASSPAVAVPANGSVTVSNLGTNVDLYRARTSSGVLLGNYVLVSPSGGVTGSYVDAGAVSGAALPQADNRPANFVTGWTEFAPGVGLAATTSFSAMSATSPSVPATCKGWTVDAAGGMTFPTGSWTFQARLKPGAAGSGTALLTAGMWKINDSGSTVGGYVVSPTDGSVITSGTGAALTATVTASPAAFSLGTGEHLCVQFWRHQTVAYFSGGTNHTISLLGYDAANQITAHPAPDAFPNAASLNAPADGAVVTSIPTFSAGYSDPEASAGTVTFRICADAGCASVNTTSPAQAVANGASASWAPGSLADGTWYWQAAATDSAGGTSGWSPSRSFRLDTVFPNTPTLVSPAAGATTNSSELTATFSSADVAETGTLDFRVCTDTLCGTVLRSGSSPSVTNGANGTWTISASLGDGTYGFQARAVDSGGNPSSWSAGRSFTLDITAPETTIGPAKPADPTNSTGATIDFTSGESGSSFRCSLDSGPFGACTSPATYAGLAGGSHTFQVEGTDAAGNADPTPASFTWTVDTVAPDTTIGPTKPADPSNSTNPTFDFTSSESGSSFRCRRDAGAWSSCTAPKTYSGLAAGNHTVEVEATDPAGNADPTPASYTWTIDTTAPDTTIGPTKPATPTGSTGATFDFSSSESGSSFRCRLDGGAFAGCTSPLTYSGLGGGSHTFEVEATDAAGNADPTAASFTWTIDTAAPATTIGPTKPADPTNATSASFSFSASESGSTFRCRLDAGAFGACTSPVTYSGLGAGSHTFQVEATDAVGNAEPTPARFTWTIDTTAPDTTLGAAKPADPSNSASAAFDFASSESGSSFRCRLDGGAWSSCTTPKTYSSLANGSHSFSVEARDAAGNADATPAGYSWTIDTTVPTTPTSLAPADELWTTTIPRLSGKFSDPKTTDTGTVQFRVCSSAAAAGSACSPVVQAGSSAGVSSGSAGNWTPSGLGDGLYHWQARGEDVAGNDSAWTATRRFHLDTTTPAVPALVSPDEGAWQSHAGLSARFSDPAFAATGTLTFRLCSDPSCFAVVESGDSAKVSNGTEAEWRSQADLADRGYYWSVRANDAAGNQSAWSAPRLVHLDKTPPATPTNFNGHVAANGLTLRWDPPANDVANFYIYVDGVSTASVGATTYEYNVGGFDADDPRRFGVVTVDHAGNQSPMSKLLVGVPEMVGLTLAQAEDAAKARGLVVRREATIQQAGGSGVITSQNPAAGSVAEKGTAVKVVISASTEQTALTMSASPRRLVCGAGTVVRLRVSLSESATVRALLQAGTRTVATSRLGLLRAGTSSVRVKLPRKLGRATYKLVLDATAGNGRARTVVAIAKGARRACSSR